MKQPLFSKEERLRRLQIIERGMTTDFWKVWCDSMIAYCAMRTREVMELSSEGKKDEAERIAIEVRALERFMADPSIIVQHNKPLFELPIREKIKQALSQKEAAHV